jgi:hypothetical protein
MCVHGQASSADSVLMLIDGLVRPCDPVSQQEESRRGTAIGEDWKSGSGKEE